ncbi:MAG: hypothetical protein JNK88_00365 [Mangrovicoccus sp.]|nr:hypothetical protein [Mangrovicoccus sp.]
MDEAPSPEPANLRFLRLLVTVLTTVMILGIAAVVGLLILRLSTPPRPTLPEAVTLPDGVRADAVTFGAGWYAVVTDADTILIFDSVSGKLRQSVTIAPAAQ